MLFTLRATGPHASGLGYLLHKHPDKLQTFPLAFGRAHVFYPEASAEAVTAALLVDLDPVALVRGRPGSSEGGLVDQYVNDRPYAASSFLSVAIAQVLGSALAGRCKDRPELVQTSIPLEATLSAVPCRGGATLLRALFEPLGYEVTASRLPLDERFPAWGEGTHHDVRLRKACSVSELLSHVYVLVPVLDDDKHYWVGDDEVEKLLYHGEGWLAAHPEKELIARRYLKHRARLARAALDRLVSGEAKDPDAEAEAHAEEEAAIEAPVRLDEARIEAVARALSDEGAKTVVDLGCGEGKLLAKLVRNRAITQIVGVDVSQRALDVASERLKLDRHGGRKSERIELLHGSLLYRDARLSGFDAAALVEVIEHLELSRLGALERSVFEHARPRVVVVTTPNAEYNVVFTSLPAGHMRHKDHRFEWTRAEFEAWARGVAERNGYAVRFAPIGPVDETLGSPTQMAVFSR
ncbi:3' terminal RNA ribose 2'-O-methyltransferase Hen1 [Polyangium sp. y55x31]|uniref:3' terminal RNA ribose 2'-O-methyltransferase Hen1 n=1 Tax=Polyangium sp. y55x31 TaxID=3042688 RepID=UPI002482F4AC|nr:3' terminal RNA ribose 2'-O-methyltransferase Hen1 [Polyangium sp. y55x31]MDI1481716.1 3' terminal RNA ribose 2'-O-methyltransferase Hen1 [Polyangium sp. y55x31]